MAATIKFGVWSDDISVGPDCESSENLALDTAFQSGDYILHNIFNGILRDVSLITVSLVKALCDKAGTAADSMTFDNSQTLADTTDNIKTLLSNINVKSADSAAKWTSQVAFSIIDDYSHSGAVSNVDGSVATITLKLPDTIQISSLTSNNIYTDTISAMAGTIKIKDSLLPVNNGTTQLGESSKKFSIVYANTFNGALTGNVTGNVTGDVIGTATSASKLTYTQTGSSVTQTRYLTGCGSSSSGNKVTYVMSDLKYHPNTKILDTNISGSAEMFNLTSFEQVYGNGTAASTVVVTGYKHDMKAIYFVTYDYFITSYNSTPRYAMGTIMLKDSGSGDGTDRVYAADNLGNIFALRLRFQYRDRTTNHNVSLEYSNDGGTTWNACTNERIVNIARILCG